MNCKLMPYSERILKMLGKAKRFFCMILLFLCIIGQARPIYAQIEPITRWQFARLINRAAGFDKLAAEPFPDVEEGSLYYTEMMKAKYAGYLTGDETGFVYPERAVSKAEAAVIFVKALGWDASKISVHEKAYEPELEWAASSLEIMKYLGIYSINTYAKEALTEEEAISMAEKLENARDPSGNNPYAVKQVDLKDDFFTYINNSWLIRTKIEDGNSNVSTFTQISRLVDGQIKGILEECLLNQSNYGTQSNEWKMAEIYKMFLNTQARNRLGYSPLQDYIELVMAAETPEDLKMAIEQMNVELGTGYLYNLSVSSDEMDRRKNALYLGGANLGILNDAYYYLSKEEFPQAIRQEYKNYLKSILLLIEPNELEAEKKAEKVFEFEKELAEARATGGTTHDMSSFYNVYSLIDLGKITPKLRMDRMIYDAGYIKANQVIVTNPEEILFLESYFTQEHLEEIKYYLFCNMISHFSSLLSEEISGLYTDFYNRLSGAQGAKSLEAQAIDLVGTYMPDAVSEKFVIRFSSKTAKNDVEKLVKEIIRKYRSRLENNDWLQSATKKEAIVKLDNIGIRVGYPSRWKNYDYLEVKSYRDKGNLVEIYKSIIKEKNKEQIQKLNEPVDRRKWDVTAYETNAYYDVNTNSIIIPAGILQNPIYREDMSKEEKLGGIGVIIGHEISHAFDTIGAQYDENGNIRDWWSAGDYEKFRERAREVANYYSDIEIIDGKTIDGYLTLSETVADLGGISCALEIMKDMQKYNAKEFFETQAKVFRNKARNENVIFSLSFDVHNPMVARVNHTLNMFEEFYKTYGIEPGDGMYIRKEDRVSVW